MKSINVKAKCAPNQVEDMVSAITWDVPNGSYIHTYTQTRPNRGVLKVTIFNPSDETVFRLQEDGYDLFY